jgi:tetratricopeptide (TPR) repeat protein
LAKDFPIWGTGYGTFQYVEPLTRRDPESELIWSNAESDYVEALVEGGLVRLAISVLAIGFLFWLGYRAVRFARSQQAGALAMGALFGLTAIVVHSFVDFGLHIPAIAVLAAVVCAHLAAAGARSQTGGRPTTEDPSGIPDQAFPDGAQAAYSLRLGGLAPVAGAIVLVAFALLVGYEGRRLYKAQQVVASLGQELVVADDGSVADPASVRVKGLATAARWAPRSARLQVNLALANYDVYLEQRKHRWILETVAGATQNLSDLAPVHAPLLGPASGLTSIPVCVLTTVAGKELRQRNEQELSRHDLAPALSCFLRARELCPILPEPHRFLADNRDALEQADPRLTYLERAKLLVPYDPGVWYACGRELLDTEPDRAWKNWRHSLELSDMYLPVIFGQAGARISPREILDKVFPERPSILLAAALQFYPEPSAERQLFLDRALGLLENQPTPSGKDQQLKALILRSLGRVEEATAAYQAALAKEPRQLRWRLDYADFLRQQHRAQDSRRELLTVLALQPDYPGARELLTIVERQIAEGK